MSVLRFKFYNFTIILKSLVILCFSMDKINIDYTSRVYSCRLSICTFVRSCIRHVGGIGTSGHQWLPMATIGHQEADFCLCLSLGSDFTVVASAAEGRSPKASFVKD